MPPDRRSGRLAQIESEEPTIDILHAIFLGVVQGLTEFLPISSSGHLVLADHLMGHSKPDLFFDTVLHLGTLVAVIGVLRRDVRDLIVHVLKAFSRVGRPRELAVLYREDGPFRLALLIVLGTLPAVVIGFSLKDTFEQLFSSVLAVGIALCVTGTFLLATRFARTPEKDALATGWKESLLIGLAQAVAITPGISRSGATISAALLLRVDRDLAGRFSFLLSIPAILGAVVLQMKMPEAWPPGYGASLAVGFLSSAIVGFAALKILIGLVKQGKFFYFGFYCIPIGILSILWAIA